MAGRSSAFDPETLAFYSREAATYASRERSPPEKRLAAFLDRLTPGARILELGCGGGDDAAYMVERGFDVDATDGCPELAAIAQAWIGRPVRVMMFDEIEDKDGYDAVWANAALHHAPDAALPGILARVHQALRPRGLFYAGYKGGEGGNRDSFGRYYSFPTKDRLRQAYLDAAPWSAFEMTLRRGGGYDGVTRTWLHCTAVK